MCPSGFAHYDAVKVVPYKLYFWSTFFVDLKNTLLSQILVGVAYIQRALQC